MTSDYAQPQILIETDELAERLSEPALRVVDCKVKMEERPAGGFDLIKGFDDWLEGHIPGADFIDLVAEISAPHPTLPFMMPDADLFARVVGARGIGNESDVVLYSGGWPSWATRLYFMFRAMGHDRVRVLNGGLEKWKRENRPLSIEPVSRQPVWFRANPRAAYLVGKDSVRSAMGDKNTQLVCTLSAAVFTGEKNLFGRAGHIPGSVNIAGTELVDAVTGCFLPAEQLREKLAPAMRSARVITYCGAGISATVDAFALLLLGHDAAAYDGSLLEWGADESLPLRIGPAG